MIRRLGASLVAAAALGGALVMVLPQHAASVLSLAMATAVVVGAGFLLVIAGSLHALPRPETALDRTPVTAPRLDPQGLRDARRDLARPAATGQLPRAVWDRITVAGVLTFSRRGIDLEAAAARHESRRLLTPATWQLLTSPPPPRQTAIGHPARLADSTARSVHRVLDELDALAPPPGGRHDRR